MDGVEAERRRFRNEDGSEPGPSNQRQRRGPVEYSESDTRMGDTASWRQRIADIRARTDSLAAEAARRRWADNPVYREEPMDGPPPGPMWSSIPILVEPEDGPPPGPVYPSVHVEPVDGPPPGPVGPLPVDVPFPDSDDDDVVLVPSPARSVVDLTASPPVAAELQRRRGRKKEQSRARRDESLAISIADAATNDPAEKRRLYKQMFGIVKHLIREVPRDGSTASDDLFLLYREMRKRNDTVSLKWAARVIGKARKLA